MNDTSNFGFKNGRWSMHSMSCVNEEVKHRKSKCPDNNIFLHCYNFSFIDAIRFRIRWIIKVLPVEQFITENK